MIFIDPAWSPNYYANQNDVRGIVIHHAATTSLAAVAATFSTTARQASAHYGIQNETVQQYVHEYDGAWHAGDYWANTHTIGIENVNATAGPYWYVDERTVETCCELMADIAWRHDLYPLKRNKNVWGHKDFQSTYCPGVLYDRLDYMCERANTIYYKKYIEGDDDMATAEDVWGYNWENTAPQGNLYNCVIAIYKKIEALEKKVADLETKVDKVSVGGIDVKAVAKAVNDDAANRMKA